ncbi:MAG: hypothetical protein WBQ44_10265 [Rhodococcus sp. (in: high G+C Gram-positive bacteria)]
MSRLTYDDDLFLRMECVLGVPVVNQIVWRFDEPAPHEALEKMWRNLAAGPLDRKVVRARLPGARDRWVPGAVTVPLTKGAAVVDSSGVGTWMHDRAATPLDPLHGPSWQLSYADVSDGGSLVSLVASHVVGDGGALTSAAIAALAGPEEPDDFRSAWDVPSASDVHDSVGQLRAAATGTARALVRGLRAIPARRTVERSQESAATKASIPSAASGRFTPSTVVVDCPTQQWTAAAVGAGGSANSLLVAVALGILAESGRVAHTDSVRVSLPVSTRVTGDVRANATSGVAISVAGDSHRRSDLTAVRRDSKAAFTALADASHSTTFELTKPLMQMLPDAVVAKASKSATAPLCLCSNLGDRGERARFVGGLRARSVAMRSITQNTTAELLRRTRGGVSVWWNHSGETSTLCVTGLDPDCFPTAERLRELVAVEYDRWQIEPTFW